jgi:hypothetical protein
MDRLSLLTQHHPELKGDISLSALQRGKVCQVLGGRLILTCRLPPRGFA